jgi:hypothetical protein
MKFSGGLTTSTDLDLPFSGSITKLALKRLTTVCLLFFPSTLSIDVLSHLSSITSKRRVHPSVRQDTRASSSRVWLLSNRLSDLICTHDQLFRSMCEKDVIFVVVANMSPSGVFNLSSRVFTVFRPVLTTLLCSVISDSFVSPSMS